MQVFLTLQDYLALQEDLEKKLDFIQQTIDKLKSSLTEATTELVRIYKDEYTGKITEDNFAIFKAKVDSQLEVIAAISQENLKVEKELLLEVGDSISMNRLLLRHVPLYVESDDVETVEAAMKQGMLMLVNLKKQISHSVNKDSCEI